MLRGVDVSVVQGAVPWADVAASGVAFSIVKVCEGDSYRDPRGPANLQGARAAGLVVGSYGVVRPSGASDPAAQARAHYGAVKAAGGLLAGDLPHAVDFEERGTLSDVELARWLDAHCAEWERLMGRPALCYTYPSFFAPLAAIAGPATARTVLWWASYGQDTGATPTTFAPPNRIPLPWRTCWFWQFTSKARLSNGTPVDGDGFDGTLDALRAMCLTGDVQDIKPLFVPPDPDEPTPPDEAA